MNYAGFYINLDRSVERRAQIESQLAEYGLSGQYRRFSASDGNSLNFPAGTILPGEMGCFISHYQVLKENFGSTAPLHVIEDDVVFSRHAAEAINSIIAGGRLDHYDIIYADFHIPISNIAYREYKNLFDKSVKRDAAGRIEEARLSVVDLKNIGFATTSSMVISPKAIGKLRDLYEAELRKGPQKPIDIFIRQKTDEGILNVGSIFPFVTSVRLDSTFDTTLGARDLRFVALAGVIARHSFFVDCDMKQCRDYAFRYLRADPDDIHRQILTHILGASLDPLFSSDK